jgi:L-rhamnose mutarotase
MGGGVNPPLRQIGPSKPGVAKIMHAPKIKRYGQIIGMKPDAYDRYVEYHAKVWPEVLKTIYACNIRNYSIFFKDNTLFAYFEYVGDSFEADMAKMAADPTTQEWWSVMKPMQEPIPTRAEGEWWADMKEVFHVD